MQLLKTKSRAGVITDYTEGSVTKQLLSFTLPFILASLLQQLYNVVNMIVVGQFVGSVSLSAVSVGGQATDVMTNICMGFSNAGQIIIAQQIGAKDYKGISRSAGTMFIFIFLLSIFLMIFCLVFHNAILTWLNTPEEAMLQARQYMFICSFGFIFISGYNCCCAVLRGSGNSRHPLIFVAISSVINFVLAMTFVGGFGMKAAGTAIATVISQFISFAMAFSYIYRHREGFGFDKNLKTFRPDMQRLGALLRLGVPLAIQGCAIQISQLFVNSYVNTYGIAASATMGIGRNLQQFCNIINQGVRQAATAMIGQNMGARKIDRVSGVVRISVFIGLGSFAVVTAVSLLFPTQIFSIFTDDPEVLALAPTFLGILVVMFFASAFNTGYGALIQGVGFTTLSMTLALLDGVVFRIGLSVLFGVTLNWGLVGLFLGNNLAIYATTIPSAIYYFSGRWKNRRLLILKSDKQPG